MNDNNQEPEQPISQVWKRLDKTATKLIKVISEMMEITETLIDHSLQSKCLPVSVPQRKENHLKEREKYAKDYKQCIINQMSFKIKQGFTLKGAQHTCNKCQMVCRNKKRYFIHVLRKHSNNFMFYCCIICHKKFDNFFAFKQHLCTFHDDIMIFRETELILQIIDYGIRVIQEL